MGSMEGHLGNATPPTSWHELQWWKSPRWIVIRIEALAVVAIIFSFFLASFGSCRRWSNSWIVQKGFLAAQVLSLSLGTYSIGIMQSSSVKSEMYPIWTVSLFTLFGCIDPVTTYNGLDYKGALSKVVYGICLNCGYVLLMSISTITNVAGNAAIITLSAITFIKGFHRSFAIVEQNKIRDMVYAKDPSRGEACIIRKDEPLSPDDPRYTTLVADLDKIGISQQEIESAIRNNNDERLRSCYDVCVALCLSHRLECHILGLDYRVPRPGNLKGIDYKWAMKVIEIELAFLYDAFFTGSPFLHYSQAKTASLWALASLIGICFVLVATAIPGGMSSRRPGASGGSTKVVDTTTADLAITFGILVSLALLQLTQLVRSWTSNWARVAVACAYARKGTNHGLVMNYLQNNRREEEMEHLKPSGWMRLKAFVATSTNLFDKYLWQEKISQYSMLPDPRLMAVKKRKGELIQDSSETKGGRPKRGRCADLVRTLGLHYIWLVIWKLLSSESTKSGDVKLDEDVKASVTEFLGQIESDRLDNNWLSSLPEEPQIRHFLPHVSEARLLKPEEHCYRYMSCVMTWHIATWYCEVAEHKRQQETAAIGCGWETAASYLRKAAAAIPRPGNCFQRKAAAGGGEGGTKTRDHRRVANALSQYCVYLVKSSPELLPGPVAWTKRVYDSFVQEAKLTGIEDCDKDTILETMADGIVGKNWNAKDTDNNQIWDPTLTMDFLVHRFPSGGALAKLLMRRSDTWEVLARVWAQLLVYAAPYGNAEEHRRRLSHGGEFITHVWALLYHLDIREWKLQEANNLHNISTIKDAAQRILDDDDHDLDDVVVFFASPERLQQYHDPFVTASRPIDGVKFYLTSSPYVATFLNFPETSILKGIGILFLNKTEKKSIFFDSQGACATYDFAHFVYENKLASAKARAQETAPSTIPNISTIEDAQRILDDDDHDPDIVVFFASPERLQQYHDPFVTASRPIDGVKFYLTSSPDVATFLNFPETSILKGIGILFLTKTEKKSTFVLSMKKYTFFDSQGACTTNDFAHFVYENKLASAEARAQETAPPTIPNPISIEEQSSEDRCTVVDIEEEIPPPPEARAQETAPPTIPNPIPIEEQSSEDGHTVVDIEEEIPPPPPSS